MKISYLLLTLFIAIFSVTSICWSACEGDFDFDCDIDGSDLVTFAAGFGLAGCGPTEEICDGRDNDCDGQTDEDFMTDGVYALNTHCGDCNTDCTEIYALVAHQKRDHISPSVAAEAVVKAFCRGY